MTQQRGHQNFNQVQPLARNYQITVDPIPISIWITSFATRCYNIGQPRAVVFDELHYIKFVSLYLKRIFFFDPQPPFGKQLMALLAYLVGFQGDLSYSQIGDIYKSDVPIEKLRLLTSFFGSLIAPLGYLVCQELDFRQTTSILVALLIILENSLLTQSRFLLLDPLLLLLSLSSVYFYLRFTKGHSIHWLGLACLSATLAAATKYSGLYSYALIVCLTLKTWWNLIERFDGKKLANYTCIIFAFLFVAPLIIYTSIYYVHLSWLIRAGPHDTIMTSAFQASLENGLASITRGQPLEIVHGSQITLRHTHGRSCWLHSHEHLYPIKYSDGRGSSHQQQVTCYSFKDINNWWIIKRPHVDELVVSEPFDKIKQGDLVQLVHGMTGRTLNSHDVASAMSPYSQEVSCYVDHNVSMPAQNVWRVHLLNAQDTNDNWHTINSQVQLIHLNSSLALRFSGRQLPDWGYHQHEVVADKDLKNDDTIWNVEEHRHTKSEDQREREVQFGQVEFAPLEPTSLSFFEKLYELHYKIATHQQETIKDHIYACDSPLDWVLMRQGTAYWVDNANLKETAQIFLIGNVVTNLVGSTCVALLSFLLVFHILCRRRQVKMDNCSWQSLELQAVVLLGGYTTQLVPYFLYESPLFLQYYLSAMVFKILIIGAVIDQLHRITNGNFLVRVLEIILVLFSLGAFVKLAPLAYGTGLSGDQVEKLRWADTWQLINLSL